MDCKFAVLHKCFSIRFVLILTLVSSLFSLKTNSFGDEQPSGTECERFAFPPGRPIAVPVEIFGQIQNLYLSTTVGTIILDESNREKLRRLPIPKNLKIPPSNAWHEYFPSPEIRVGKANPDPFCDVEPVAVSSKMRDFLPEIGMEGTGFLGMDYLNTKVLRLCPDEGYAQIDSVTKMHSEHAERITLRENSVNMLIKLPSGFESSKIDTVSVNSVTLTTAVFNKLLARRQIVLTQPKCDASTGPTCLGGVLEWLEIGPFRVHNVVVYEGKNVSIGLKFLERFESEFDFPNRIAYFKPGKRFFLADPRTRSGFGIRRWEGRTFIIGVDPAGIAAQADIRNGDRLLKINETNTDQLSFFKIREMHSEPGVELSLTIERDGETRDVVLQTTNEPDPFPTGPERTAGQSHLIPL